MAGRFKFKGVFLYSLGVWLTSAVVGSLLFIWYMQPGGMKLWTEFLEAFLISLLFSSPSFLLLLAVVAHVRRRPWRMGSRKLVVAAIALALTALAYLLLVWLVGLPFISLVFGIYPCYAAPLLASIFIFRFPPVQPVGHDSHADELRAPSL